MLELTGGEKARFWEKIDRSGACWLWRLATNNRGYGQTSFRRGDAKFNALAHRLAYFLTTGEEPIEMHHLCGNRRCCNPTHMTPVERGHRKVFHRRSACPKGHVFTTENTYVTREGHRLCRTCNAAWHRNHRLATLR